MQRAEEGTGVIGDVSGRLEVLRDQGARRRVQRDVARLLALAGDFQVRDTAPLVPGVLDLQAAQLVTA